MGHIVVKGTVAARRRVRVEFLVDTGATFTILPPSVAVAVDAPVLPQRFAVSLADGRRRRLKACSVGVTIAGRSGPTTALLLPGGEPLLGFETLEALGLKVDPKARRLEPSRARTALLVGVRARPLARRAPAHSARTPGSAAQRQSPR